MFGYPSSLLYGAEGRRWWLVATEDGRVYDRVILSDGTLLTDESGNPIPRAHRELFAVRADANFNLTWQQVCDSYGKFSFPLIGDGSFNGEQVDGGFSIQWSSEGLDDFVYAIGTDISPGFQEETIENENGEVVTVTTLDFTQGYTLGAICRVDAAGLMTVGQSVEAGNVLPSESITILPGSWPTSNVVSRRLPPMPRRS